MFTKFTKTGKKRKQPITVDTGIEATKLKNGKTIYTANTVNDFKSFKTKGGAERWLARKGFKVVK